MLWGFYTQDRKEPRGSRCGYCAQAASTRPGTKQLIFGQLRLVLGQVKEIMQISFLKTFTPWGVNFMSFLIKHPEDLKNLFQEDLTNEEKKTTWKDLTNLVKRRKEDFLAGRLTYVQAKQSSNTLTSFSIQKKTSQIESAGFTAKGPEFDFWEVDSARALFGPDVAISLYKFEGVLREGHFIEELQSVCCHWRQFAESVGKKLSKWCSQGLWKELGLIRWQMRWG